MVWFISPEGSPLPHYLRGHDTAIYMEPDDGAILLIFQIVTGILIILVSFVVAGCIVKFLAIRPGTSFTEPRHNSATEREHSPEEEKRLLLLDGQEDRDYEAIS